MTYYQLPIEEQTRVREMIQKIIGRKEDQITEDMSRDTRIKVRFAYDKLFEKLAKVWANHGDKALSLNYTDKGAVKEGVTPNGKKWVFYMNNFGWTDRAITAEAFTLRAWDASSLPGRWQEHLKESLKTNSNSPRRAG